jgi:hypothetical protein
MAQQSPSFSPLLIKALIPFSSNPLVAEAIASLQKIAAAETKSKQPIITDKKEVLYFLCLVSVHVSEVMQDAKKAKLFIELAQHCLEHLPAKTKRFNR